jgi:hypothetical protein
MSARRAPEMGDPMMEAEPYTGRTGASSALDAEEEAVLEALGGLDARLAVASDDHFADLGYGLHEVPMSSARSPGGDDGNSYGLLSEQPSARNPSHSPAAPVQPREVGRGGGRTRNRHR